MQYFSTNRKSPPVSFRDAVVRGQPDDKGLYFPERIPELSPNFTRSLACRSNEEIAFEVMRRYVDGEIPDATLFDLCSETINFPFPLVPVAENIFSLELFHGPTLAFKDVGARFMSRCLRYFSREKSKKTIVLVATSGDTGGAVASGFHRVEGIEVVILYPKGKVSRVQELQLTTLGGNVTALEVRGSFDDCQSLAKRALADAQLRGPVFLTSANSINIARWLPQQFYYFFAMKEWEAAPPVFSVPCGNLGNIAAGLLANRSGLPAATFIAACNANDVVPKFLTSGEFQPAPAVATLSNAMDVGDPSNLVRILEIFGNSLDAVRKRIAAVSVSDERTAQTMKSVYEATGYVLDPHGAVAYRALADHLDRNPNEKGIFLETAHPVKFDSVEAILGAQGEVPESVRGIEKLLNQSTEIDADYDLLKEILLSKV
jgi:threonine synthase